LEKTTNQEPSKPSKPVPMAIDQVLMVTDKTIKTGFDGFDGPYLAKSPKIEAEALDQEPARAGASLAWHGRAVVHKTHTIDQETGIWPISEWGSACGRGIVRQSAVRVRTSHPAHRPGDDTQMAKARNARGPSPDKGR
jgi:hypothetical protein